MSSMAALKKDALRTLKEQHSSYSGRLESSATLGISGEISLLGTYFLPSPRGWERMQISPGEQGWLITLQQRQLHTCRVIAQRIHQGRHKKTRIQLLINLQFSFRYKSFFYHQEILLITSLITRYCRNKLWNWFSSSVPGRSNTGKLQRWDYLKNFLSNFFLSWRTTLLKTTCSNISLHPPFKY